MERNKLISILADGKLHSGQDLANTLGVSRAAVWKKLSQLDEMGVPVRRLHGKGYCLKQPLDLLDKERLEQLLDPEQRELINLHVLDDVPSTNDYLSARELVAKYEVCLAEKQSAGKGRRGRKWEGSYGRDIALSVKFESERGVSGLDGLSLAVGVALADSLTRAGVEGISLKWPNDLWLGEKKVAGILIELSGELQTRCEVVVGIGLNVSMAEDEGASINQPWTSLATDGGLPEISRNSIAAKLIAGLISALERFEREGFAIFQAQWVSLDALKGREVFVVGQETSGLGAGIDAFGAYRLETASGEVRLNAGEVSVRAKG
ncbi:biotin--[acetyl-CoA-carboxylase] ligase [Hydrocarboniclastica marina]|uniref:biotin--[acetyl-CoA-carboxylase] ligase n=1 Tax=Hydrocarboniclastica marina TaxID=2259620 RepID=UPI00156248A0|nr:biotin--[acetyl-CoA-carboxylase] ligase [Hydrocarboniclastica marina]